MQNKNRGLKSKKMKEKLRLIRLLSKIFDIDEYYAVLISCTGIEFQGKFNSKTVVKARELNFEFKEHPNGYIILWKYIAGISFEIVLT